MSSKGSDRGSFKSTGGGRSRLWRCPGCNAVFTGKKQSRRHPLECPKQVGRIAHRDGCES